jgi:regulation of enolase protein 1 (concanavalin A-like superfamily)
MAWSQSAGSGANAMVVGAVCAVLALWPIDGALRAGNVGDLRLINPEYAPKTSDARGALAVWPPEAAKNLTYYVALESPPDMAQRLRDTFRYATTVWESAGDLRFVEVSERNKAHLIVNLKYTPGSGHYHGFGGAWPPVRETDGKLKTSVMSVEYHGEPDQAESWRNDSWVWCAVHELGHALGLFHEFERPDRDRYLRILRQPPKTEPLPVHAREVGFTADTPFDYASVMMYAWTDNDRNPQYRLVKPGPKREPAPTVSYYQRNGLSPGDVAIIQYMYGRPQGKEPIVHEPPVRDASVVRRLRQQGWTAVARDGLDMYGCRGSLVFEAEYGAWDHWAQGGNPPRLQRPVWGRPFDMSVDVKADYMAAGSFAGLFVLFNPRDWVYFGAYEHPRRVSAQRTGQDKTEPLVADSNKYRLRALYTQGCLRLTCAYAGQERVVQLFEGLPPPMAVAVGMKCWGPPECGYRRVEFRNVSVTQR